ncbi:MAG TPA: ankyrin repeat domain-containing protein [Candidatus Babeliales bacterium]|jgi:ankyrin repeat protein|nr:ankyrin repeat domain-containing protein [Candidatus Babeliales bacterium]
MSIKKIFLLFSILTGSFFQVQLLTYNPLYIAAQSGDFKMVKELVEHGVNINEYNHSTEMWADWYDQYVYLTPIYGAIYSKNIEIIEFLIHNGADLNTYGNGYHDYWPLMAAAKTSPQILEKLIQYGAFEGYEEALHILVNNNTETCFIKKILEYHNSFDINKNIFSELLVTAAKALRPINLKTFNLLIDLGADVNYIVTFDSYHDRCYKGKTPLHIIADYSSNIREGFDATHLIIQNKIDMVKILFNKGANLHARDEDEKTPFEQAREAKIIESLKYKEVNI